MYNALDISKYIINYSNKKNYGISHLKLQKILYFVQAFFLISKINHTSCFSDEIEAWSFGTIVVDVYYEYKMYGNGNIPSVSFYTKLDKHNIWDSKIIEYDNCIIKNYDKKLINAVVDKFSDYSSTELLILIHKQSPWQEAYKKGKGSIITHESMLRYFNK